VPLRVPGSPNMPVPMPISKPSETDYLMALSVMKKLGKFDRPIFDAGTFASRLDPVEGQVEDRRGNEASDAAEVAASRTRSSVRHGETP